MPSSVVPTFFKKTVSLSTSVVSEDVLTESLYVSVTPVMTNRQFTNSQTSLSIQTVLEDSLSEAISLSFKPIYKIMQTTESTTSTNNNYQYWTD